MTGQADSTLSEAKKTDLLNRVEEKAAAYMTKYGGCGQCSLRALQEEFHLPGGTAVLKAAGFSNLGIAWTENICGALIGGIMAMGLACGRENFSDSIYPQPEDVVEPYQLPRSLMLIRGYCHRFIQEFGSSSCRDLHLRIFGRSFEMVVMEEEEEFHKAGGHLRCVSLVGKAARMAAETILQLPRR